MSMYVQNKSASALVQLNYIDLLIYVIDSQGYGMIYFFVHKVLQQPQNLSPTFSSIVGMEAPGFLNDR